MAVGKEIETGKIYEGIVTSVRDYGALVELDGTGGQEGLLHISEISEKPVSSSSLCMS
jgi:polyribonucleotide nucleotidyltransferase